MLNSLLAKAFGVGRFLPPCAKVDGQALFNIVSILPAPVAQLDRASDYGSEGLKFESSRARSAFAALAATALIGGHLDNKRGADNLSKGALDAESTETDCCEKLPIDHAVGRHIVVAFIS